jgi:hypothetical protein
MSAPDRARWLADELAKRDIAVAIADDAEILQIRERGAYLRATPRTGTQ